MDIKPEHRAILERMKPHFETAKEGWVQNVTDLDMLEHISHSYLDSRFILTKWCKDCVMKMIIRLGSWYEKQPIEQPKQTTYENTRARKHK